MNYSRGAYEVALKRADKRLEEADHEEVDPDEMAKEIAAELEGNIPTEYLAEYIGNRLVF